MNTTWQQQRQEMRRSKRWNPQTRRRYEELKQAAGFNPNQSPESTEAEIEKRLLVGQKDMRDLTDWGGVDTRKIKANTDGMIASGIKTDSKTVIGRAVGINLDNAEIYGSKIVGDVNGGSAKNSRIRGVTASDINRNAFDISGSITGDNNFSGGSSIGWTQINVNSVRDSHVNSDLSKATFARGWMTQGYLDGSTISFGKILNTGLANSSLDNMFGYKAEIRPKATDEAFSVRGAKFVDSKINQIVAAKAEDDNATLENCVVVHDMQEPEAEAPTFTKRFAALDAAHAAAKPIAARRPSLRMPTPGMSLLLAGLAA